MDHPLFLDPAWYAIPNTGGYRDTLRDKARRQLGTVGSGNHYVDVFADEDGAVWVGVHFGSRGLGHTIASDFLALGQGLDWGRRAPEKEVLLDLGQPLGHDYWQLMELAGQYAYAGREWVARKVVQMLGGTELELVHNHHNFAWKETHASPRGGGARVRGGAQGRHASVPGAEGLHRRVHGRRRGHRPGRRGGGRGDGHAAARGAVLHRPRRGPRDEPHRRGGQGAPQDGAGDHPRPHQPRDGGASGWARRA